MALIKRKEVVAPEGWKLMLYRAPIFLYRIGLGGLLGNRFILLNHIGRKSGSVRQAVLEIVRHNPGDSEYVIASGFGERSQWYKNLMAHPQVDVQVGWRKFSALATLIPPAESEDEMVAYGHRNPRAAKAVAGLVGYEHDGTDEDLREFSRIVPLIRLVAGERLPIREPDN